MYLNPLCVLDQSQLCIEEIVAFQLIGKLAIHVDESHLFGLWTAHVKEREAIIVM